MKQYFVECILISISFLTFFTLTMYVLITNKGIFPSKEEYINLNRKNLSEEQIKTNLKLKKYLEIPIIIIIIIILILHMVVLVPFFEDVKYIINGNYPQFSGEITNEINKENKWTERDHFIISNGTDQLEIIAFDDDYEKGDYITVEYLPHCKVGNIIMVKYN